MRPRTSLVAIEIFVSQRKVLHCVQGSSDVVSQEYMSVTLVGLKSYAHSSRLVSGPVTRNEKGKQDLGADWLQWRAKDNLT